MYNIEKEKLKNTKLLPEKIYLYYLLLFYIVYAMNLIDTIRKICPKI